MAVPRPDAVAAYAAAATADQTESARELLERDGYVPVDGPGELSGGAALLREHLAAPPPAQAVLAERLLGFAGRPRPWLPCGVSVRTEFAWISPGRILLGREGLDSFHHDNSDGARQRVRGEISRDAYVPFDPVAGIPQFARRLAAEQGHPESLAELFGLPDPEVPLHLMVEGWWTPAGAVFRVSENGNHRLAAMAVLRAPCVLARVEWYGPTFDSSYEDNTSPVVDQFAWTDFLRTFQIVAGTGDLNHERAHHGVGLEYLAHTGPFTTRWPVLLSGPDTAKRSLAALDTLTGTTYAGGIGTLPRSLFDDPRRVRAAMRQLHRTTEKIQARAPWPAPPRTGLRRFSRSGP
jgi:hypothetical protein